MARRIKGDHTRLYRSMPASYDGIIRLWVLRLLVGFGGHRALIEERHLMDDDVMPFLGLSRFANCPAFSAEAARAALRAKLAGLEARLPELPAGTALANNLDWLGDTLQLAPVDRDLLHFAVTSTQHPILNRVLGMLGCLTFGAIHQLFALVLGRSAKEIRQAIRPSGALARTGLLHFDLRNRYCFENKVELLGGLGKRFGDLVHADDPDCLKLWQRVAEPACSYQTLTEADQRRTQMLAYQVYPDQKDAFDGPTFLDRLHAHPWMAEELKEVATWLDEATLLDSVPLPSAPAHWPLRLHAAYDIREILTAVGWLRPDRRAPFQSGVLPLADEKIELLFVTLDKRTGYHAGIAYHDYAISPELFHWQTQNTAGPDTPGGRRYLESDGNGWTFQLFVRGAKGFPYRALGRVRMVSVEGDRPMSVTWALDSRLPAAMWKSFGILR